MFQIRRQRKGKTVRDNDSYLQDNNNPARKSLTAADLEVPNGIPSGYTLAIEPSKSESDDESNENSRIRLVRFKLEIQQSIHESYI